MGDSSGESQLLECDWVTYKGRRVRSRIRRVRNKVVQSIEKRVSRSTLDEIMEDEWTAEDTIAKKESILARAMDLNEELSDLERKKETIRNEMKALEKEVSCLDVKITSIRSHVDFKTPNGITDLSAEITQLKRNVAMPHMHPFDPDFEDSPALCATCARVVSKLSAFPCHNCGFFVCQRCLEKARQCPKCLMGSIDDYTCHDDDSAANAAPRKAHLPDRTAAIVSAQQRHGNAGGEPLYHMLDGGEGEGDGSDFDSDSASATDGVREENIYQALEDFEKPVAVAVGKCAPEGKEEEEEERQVCQDGDSESTTSQKQEGYAVVVKPILKRSGALEDNDMEERDSNFEQTAENGSQVVKDSEPPLEEVSRIARIRLHFESNGK